MTANIVDRPDEILNSNLFVDLSKSFNHQTFLKIEGMNFSGSIKLKAARWMLDDLEQRGQITSETTLIESSSGNLGVALAMICASRNIRFICVVDANSSAQKVRKIKAYGAEVVQITNPDDNGGFLGSRIKYIQDYVSNNPNTIWINQYKNEMNWGSHELSTAREIFESFPHIDYLYVGVGTGGTLKGIAEYLRKTNLITKVIAVDSMGSITFGGKPGPRRIPGLGASVKPHHFCFTQAFACVNIDEHQAVESCKKFARQGYYFGGSTGTILAAIEHCKIPKNENDIVVCISPDMGDSYGDIVYI
ncbi:TPA: 2,3-diaminopropionate biosynthesis protein SbnA [Vibrio cholerae]|uniref:2,3-diaminopropionate biosynthesis protein SbnA n=1 Tax=Vibrio cholerae TaxID=666 RepID=UPI00226E5AD8|nr:2,3-diaminopropionate biosynthesis protein SbnA [Vibrio cholerae]MCX9439919.1 2,3-diaminopropionate biosynthesis protein SbnA [Vibrio cholerae]HDI3164212.1 2,3-diaminopropionate biosynthesis protein SbnA [Vibrio cholerae]